MFRRSSAWLLTIVIAAAGSARADDVERFLERQGLTRLLVRHLESKLNDLSGDDLADVMRRLADLYAELLETETDADRRADLESRSRRLIAEAPAGATDALRLALLRASYRAAESAAENHRLGLASPEEVEQATRTLGDLIPRLQSLRGDLEARAESLDRRLGRAAGVEAIVLEEELEQQRQLHASTTFLVAWALYYQSWLNERPENARAAQNLFADVLGLDDQPVLPELVTVDLRSFEPIARTILGLALCKSLTAPSRTALEWIDLLEHPETFEAVRTQAPAWRIAIHLEHDEFDLAREVLEGAAPPEGAPIAWLRLMAVSALRAEERSSRATELARYAMTRLAARGELGQVFDLAERFGTHALGDRGFAMRYVRGAIAYYRAREAHGGDDPTTDSTIAAMFDDARADIRAALNEPDADAYADAWPDCRRLEAWCFYFAGRLLAAATAFEEVAPLLPGDGGADALWMAIVCLDRIVEADPHGTSTDRLAELTRRFLAEHPGHAQAPRLVLRNALRRDELDPQAVDELLAIPPTSEVYDAARQRAAQVLYRLFRAAESESERATWGDRFLAISVPVQERERGVLDVDDDAAVRTWVTRARRILEVSLHDSVAAAAVARSTLDALAELATDGVDLTEFAEEVAYRTIRERLLSGAPAEAASATDALREAAPGSDWTRLAVRSMFASARERWIETSGGADDRLAIDHVLRYGELVIAEYADDADAMENPAILAAFTTVAQASMAVWERSADRIRGERALALFKRLLAARPHNATFLRATAILAQPLGDGALTLSCWRTLLAGLPDGSDGWFEARFHVAELVAADDPARALEILQQHVALHPDWGPQPWGARLRALSLRLEARLAPEAQPEAGEP